MDADFDHIRKNYESLEKSYGPNFPVPDWRDRLNKGNQVVQLGNIMESIAAHKERMHEVFAPARSPRPMMSPDRPSRPRRSASRAVSSSQSQPRARRPAEIKAEIGGAGVRAADPATGPEVLHLEPAEAPEEEDVLVNLAAEDEEEIAQVYGRAFLPILTHDNRLRAEVIMQQNYEALNAVHLMQTDNNVQPVMGAVHMVHAAASYSDKHFMHDVDGDINEGQRVLVEKSKRGPFRTATGASTVMDRSTHITYRKRGGAFEITVRRGAVNAEVQQLMSKLSMHRMSVHGSHVVIIKGTKRFRLGPLSEINLRYLRELIEECLDQYGTCGLEITEVQAGHGALYKPGAHSARFKSKARRAKPAH